MMKRLLIICTVFLFFLSACDNDSHQTYQGYIENELSYIASPISGKLIALNVNRGDTIKKGDPLFSLESEPQQADQESANANLNAALYTLQDLEKGARPPELAQIKAQILQARAGLEYNQKEFMRRKELIETDNIQVDLFDQTTRDVATSIALIEQLDASLEVAKLPAREDQINAQRSQLAAARAALKKAQWTLLQKSVIAPVDATVFDTFYHPGEQVPSNIAVISLLDPLQTKAILFVPETYLSQLTLGQFARIDCDQCKENITGKVSFISPQSEYSPPVIYSRENRTKLVYRIEISFPASIAKKLHPGQPIDVTL